MSTFQYTKLGFFSRCFLSNRFLRFARTFGNGGSRFKSRLSCFGFRFCCDLRIVCCFRLFFGFVFSILLGFRFLFCRCRFCWSFVFREHIYLLGINDTK